MSLQKDYINRYGEKALAAYQKNYAQNSPLIIKENSAKRHLKSKSHHSLRNHFG